MITSFRLTINDFPENGPNNMMREEDGGKGSLSPAVPYAALITLSFWSHYTYTLKTLIIFLSHLET